MIETAGRLRVADTFTLAWDDVRLAGDRLALQARLEGFAVAPLLARWQPDMGWEGNLRVGGRLEVALGETTRIEAVIEREGGDLGVRESDELSIPFGLSDLRLALQTQDGTWTFTQALAGRSLGELGGVQQVFSTAAARWPGQDDRLEGAVLGRVANLGVWGAWVPPGWRLQGTLTADARLGGRVGAPELRGELSGNGLGVRNLLQGVHVRDGQVRLRLEGERATVEDLVGLLTSAAGNCLIVNYQESPRNLLSRRNLGQFDLIEAVVTLITSIASPVVAGEVQHRIEEARKAKGKKNLSVEPESSPNEGENDADCD